MSDEESHNEIECDLYMLSKSYEYDSSEDENGDVPRLASSGRSQFRRMRGFDSISPSMSISFFCADIDGRKKYIHK